MADDRYEGSAGSSLGAEPEFALPVDGTVEGPQVPSGRRAAATFIFLTVTLDMLALGMIAPVLPRLITGFLGGNAVNGAQMLGLFGTVFAGIQFVFSPVLGSLSDRFGRRPVVLLSNFGLGLDYLVMAWAPTLPWLFVGRVVSGLTASSVPTAMAYIADVTPVEKRAQAFGMLGAAFGMGFVLGPAVGGLLGSVNPRLPFLVAGALSVCNGLYGLFVLPESLSKANRSPFSWRRANPVGSVALLGAEEGTAGNGGGVAAGVYGAAVVDECVCDLLRLPISLDGPDGGAFAGGGGVFSGLYSALLVKRAGKLLGERGAMSVGLLFGAAGWVMMGLSRTGMLLWMAIPVLNLMAIVWPSAQGIMSREIGPTEQGQLQGAVNSLRGMAGLVGPGLFTFIFSQVDWDGGGDSCAGDGVFCGGGDPACIAGGFDRWFGRRESSVRRCEWETGFGWGRSPGGSG